MSETGQWLWLDGPAVRKARQKAKLRQGDVAIAMRRMGYTWGFSQSRISHIETGTDGGIARCVSPRQATMLAAVLGVSVWKILCEDTAEDPRVGEARELVNALAEQVNALIAKLASVLG